MVSKIRVGVDMSEKSNHLLAAGCQLANTSGAQLSFVRAVSLPPLLAYGLEPSYIDPTDGVEAVMKTVERVLRDRVDSLQAVPKGAKCEVVHGAAEQVLGSGKDELVVVGHNHKKLLQRAFAGSTATRVVRRASGPVLVLPDSTNLKSIEKIYVLEDFSEASSRVPAALTDLGLLNEDVELCLMFAFSVPDSLPDGAVMNFDPNAPTHRALVRGFEALIADRVAALTPKLPCKVSGFALQTHDGVIPGLLAGISVGKPDLVAMGSTGRSAIQRVMLGSVAEGLMHQTSTPLLVIR